MMPSAKLLNSRIFKGLSLLLPLTLAGAIASPTYPQACRPALSACDRTFKKPTPKPAS